MTAIVRIGVFYASLILAGAIVAVWIYVSAWAAIALVLTGAAIAGLSTVELDFTPTPEPEEIVPGAGVLRHRQRDEIEASAAQARAREA